MVPMYANAYMVIYEEKQVLQRYKSNILSYYKFIDDLLIIWNKLVEEAQNMVQELNQLQTPVRFTAEISAEKVHYLDLQITVGPSKLQYSLYTKPTDRNTILHYQSAHPRALKNSLPKAQFLRVIRNNSDVQTMETQITEMKTKFLQRGYNCHILETALQEAQKMRAVEIKSKSSEWCSQCYISKHPLK
ncbi:Hypothetical predicted protein [Pelobates cultripes]|uniref:Helix-turn-helix domain-containing protein n=1 Tax=Pelobates cultripes TaxID=61616 RepID=A0AAD1TEB3_PELCU|nr:Hypothetical predicted protein [Pelobates cultripes]